MNLEEEQKTYLNQLINALGIAGNVNLSGSYQDFENKYVDGKSYGAGIDYRVPTALGLLNTNLSGGGYEVNTPSGQFSDLDLRNIGLQLQKGNQQFGINYQPQGSLPVGRIPEDAMMANELPNIPLKDYLQLKYRYIF